MPTSDLTAAPAIVWFRHDLRLADHPALLHALHSHSCVIPVYIHSPDEEGDWPAGASSRWWLHHSLESLGRDLNEKGTRLTLRSGRSLDVLQELIKQTGARAVYWNRRYEPAATARDQIIKSELRSCGVTAESFNGSLLFEPWEVATKTGGPYQVFTPFWKACLARPAPASPLAAPQTIPAPVRTPDSEEIIDWKLLPKISWDTGFATAWSPGEGGATLLLQRFLKQAVSNYREARNLPGVTGTSRLSPHLHFGEISPRQIWHALHHTFRGRPPEDAHTFLSEIGWREFAYHILFHFPQTPTQPLRSDFERFRWETNTQQLRAWQRGLTGYPIVDAGMRELWTTGWMHNRVRMIVGSFLTKDLRISWTEGARWFWDTLVDADLASNTMGWQWIGGCGADAAPYFRVFNPITQGEKFDPAGEYVRRWVPELAGLSHQTIHQPWSATSDELRRAGIELGKTYPLPLVDHGEARNLALAAFSELKSPTCDSSTKTNTAKAKTPKR